MQIDSDQLNNLLNLSKHILWYLFAGFYNNIPQSVFYCRTVFFGVEFFKQKLNNNNRLTNSYCMGSRLYSFKRHFNWNKNLWHLKRTLANFFQILSHKNFLLLHSFAFFCIRLFGFKRSLITENCVFKLVFTESTKQ